MKLLYFFLPLFLFANQIHAQLLFYENFENYTPGILSDGQNGWKIYYFQHDGVAEIKHDNNKGKVLSFYQGIKSNGASPIDMDIKTNTDWNTRTFGNNICLVEYDILIPNAFVDTEFFCAENVFHIIRLSSSYSEVFCYKMGPTYLDDVYFLSDNTKTNPGTSANYGNFPTNKWISVQLYVDYLSGYLHVYIPSLNINNYRTFPKISNLDISKISLDTHTFGDRLNDVKYDNFKISAISNLPTYLGLNNNLISEFKVYPNPAFNFVTIECNENIEIEKLILFDGASGKKIIEKNYKSKNNIKLPLENIASGNYILEIESTKGKAIKKIIVK